jgi:hypothetical protein
MSEARPLRSTFECLIVHFGQLSITMLSSSRQNPTPAMSGSPFAVVVATLPEAGTPGTQGRSL